MAELVAETDLTLAIYAPSRSSSLVISFPHMGTRVNGLSFAYDKSLAEAGISALGLVGKRPHWFPRQEIATLLPMLLPIVARHQRGRVVAYGQSMGATIALMHGHALGAEVVLSFSPHFSIDPAVIGSFDPRPKSTFIPALHTGHKVEREDLPPLSLVIYDPLLHFDRVHAEQIEALSPSVHSVLATGAGHATQPFATMAPSSPLKLYEMVLGRPLATMAEDLRHLFRSSRRGSGTYNHEFSTYLAERGRMRLALEFATRAHRIQPSRVAFALHLARLHQYLGDPSSAADALVESQSKVHDATVDLTKLPIALHMVRQGERLTAQFVSSGPVISHRWNDPADVRDAA